MLKRLFTSNTRIKLLTVFLMNPEEEFFIRELTRKLDEQINSIRRELDNLKKCGLLKAKIRNRKKYYTLNNDFILLEELKSIIVKALSNNNQLVKDLSEMGEIKLLVLAGVFTGRETDSVDLLIVGNMDKDRINEYLNELKTPRPVKYAIISMEDYNYRINCKDKFLMSLIEDPKNQIPVRKI